MFNQKFVHRLCTFKQKFARTLCTFKAYLYNVTSSTKSSDSSSLANFNSFSSVTGSPISETNPSFVLIKIRIYQQPMAKAA